MLESFAFRVSVDCHACRISIPLNGLVQTASCYHCGESNTFSEDFWRKALAPERFADAFGRPSGAMETFTGLTTGLHVESGRRAPHCGKCQAPGMSVATLGPLAAHGAGTCAGCGASIRVRGADAFALSLNTGARFIVGEEAVGAGAHAMQTRTKPVAFACMSCGGGLHVDGAKRLVTCDYCKNDNYLPDGLWQLLNPVPKPVPFYMVCEYLTAGDRAEQVAHAPASELLRLAADPDVNVRRAVAVDPRTPPELLQTLAFDRCREVLEGIAYNPNVPSKIIDEMAASHDTGFRLLAVQHPRLSHDLLPRLAQDLRPEVVAAAKARIAELEAQGIHVGGAHSGGAKGLFSKLFGS